MEYSDGTLNPRSSKNMVVGRGVTQGKSFGFQYLCTRRWKFRFLAISAVFWFFITLSWDDSLTWNFPRLVHLLSSHTVKFRDFCSSSGGGIERLLWVEVKGISKKKRTGNFLKYSGSSSEARAAADFWPRLLLITAWGIVGLLTAFTEIEMAEVLADTFMGTPKGKPSHSLASLEKKHLMASYGSSQKQNGETAFSMSHCL